MLTKSFALLFYLKKRNNYVKGKLPIYMRLTINSQRIEISTKRDCEPEKWNSSAGRKNGVREDVKLLNAYLDTLQSKVYDVHRQLIETGRFITAESVKDVLVRSEGKPKIILEIFREHNDKMSRLVGTDFAPGTLERYKTSFEHTKAFIRYKYKTADLEIEKLDYDFIADYEFWINPGSTNAPTLNKHQAQLIADSADQEQKRLISYLKRVVLKQHKKRHITFARFG